MKHAVQELEGPNYKILIEDCQKVLKDYHEAGVKFDFIVNDLPEKILNVDEEADDNSSEPESNILKSSMKVLAQDGKYLCRGGCITEFELLDVIERTVTKHPTGLTFKKFVVDIPAVNEKFCFYEVARKNELTNGSA